MASLNTEGAQVSCIGLWKVYGSQPERYVAASVGGQSPGDGHLAAVRDVAFDVEPGETFVVMGLSGSGKSTLVRCLTRLIEPTAGDVSLDGRSLVGMTAGALRDLRRHEIAMVFQHFGLFPHRRVLDNVAYGLEVTGMPRRDRETRAREVLGLVGLTDWEHSYPAELSGGMRQRVGLARALAVRPRLLLLDEPFSALDPLIRRELQDEMLRLAKVMNQTSIFITHDMTEALKLGDRIAIMRDGQFVQVGSPEEIVLNPADDYVRRFAEDASRLKVVQAATAAGNPVLIGQSDSPAEAFARIEAAQAGYGFVIDAEGRPLGIVSAADLSPPASRDLVEIADRAFVTVDETTLLEQAMRPLAGSPAPVAVLDNRGRITGTIDRAGVLAVLVDAQLTAGAAR